MKQLFICITLLLSLCACSYNSINDKLVNTRYIAPTNKAPLSQAISHEVAIVHDIITVTPKLTGKFPRYRVDSVEKFKEEKDVASNKMIATAGYAAYSYGLSLLFINNACDEHGVTCKSTKIGSEEKTKRDGITAQDISYNKGKMYVSFTTDNKKTVTLPIEQSGTVTTSLRELGFPSSIEIQSRYNKLRHNSSLAIEHNLLNAMVSSQVKLDKHAPSNRKQMQIHKPLDAIQSITNKKLNAYVKSVAAPYFPTHPELAKIPTPVLPTPPKLVKSQFETKVAFDVRVAKAIKSRQTQIDRIEQRYKNDIEKRNVQLQQLLRNHQTDINKRQQQYAARLSTLKKALPQEKQRIVKQTMLEVLGQPQLKDMRFDAETRTVFANLALTQGNYLVPITFSMAAEKARELFDAPQTSSVSALFETKLHNNKLDINLNSTIVNYRGEKYRAQANSQTVESTLVEVKLTDTPISAIAQLPSSAYTEINDNSKLQLPKLSDNLDVTGVTYVNNTAVSRYQKNFEDDIPALLAQVKPKAIQRNRWLIVVGIENYQFTDQVNFAKRSATLFTRVAQKTLGIRQENTLALIDQQATSGAIIDQIKLLLAKVSKGDELYFYYAGHGIPAPSQNNEPYILPVDKVPGFITENKAMRLANIYTLLSQSKADKVTAFIDACFTGATDGKSILTGVAASRLVPKSINLRSRNITVLSASQKDQFANMLANKGHRLFSYHLMKSLLSGTTSMAKIYRHVAHNVKEDSVKQGPLYVQVPSLLGKKNTTL